VSAHVYLVGMPGAGKSSVGAEVAAALGLAFRDLDAEVVVEAGHTVDEIFRREGEAGFREREAHALREVAEGPDSVVACGAGSVLDSENRALMQTTGTVVFLDVPLDELAVRIPMDDETRPLLEDEGALEMLFEERIPIYQDIADVVVEASGTVPSVVASVVEVLG